MSEHEDRARRMGWVPEEDFRGDPDKWRTAEQFLEVGDNLMPVLKERLSALEDKFDSETTILQEKLDKSNASLQKLADHHRDVRKHAEAKARRDIEVEMREAAAAGDLAKYDSLAEEKDRAVAEEPRKPTVVPEYIEWIKDNKWYEEDPALSNYADQLGRVIAAQVNNDEDFYKEIRKRTELAFPEHAAFKKEVVSDPVIDPITRQPVPVVEGGALGGGTQPAVEKKWADLPQECKDAYEREFSDMGEYFTQEDYAKDYFASLEEDKQ